MKFPRVQVGLIGDPSQLSPELQKLLPGAIQSAMDCINNADHEKLEKQYREGVMSASAGFVWLVDGSP